MIFTRIIYILFSLCTLFFINAYGNIYQSYDKQGNVVFSDSPKPGAKAVKLPPTQTFSPPPAPAQSQSQPQTSTPFAYKLFKIITPENDATVRDNNGTVTVNIAMDPPLRLDKQDKVQLFLDGKAIGKPAATVLFTLQHVNRGTHFLVAKVIDKQNKIIATSNRVVFHMHQARITPKGIRSEKLEFPSEILRDPRLTALLSPSQITPLQTPSNTLLSTHLPQATPLQQALIPVDNTLQAVMGALALQQPQPIHAPQTTPIREGQLPDGLHQGALPENAHYPSIIQGQTPTLAHQGKNKES